MKKCTWCGKEYPDIAEQCATDGQPLAGGEPQAALPAGCANTAQEPLVSVHRPRPNDLHADGCRKLIDLGQVEGSLVFEEGYSRPDWQLIEAAIKKTVSPENVAKAWTEAAFQWAQQVGSDLGEGYRAQCSEEFIMLSALGPTAADELLVFVERMLGQILALLQDAAWRTGLGKHVIFLFAEDDDYYQYVAYFYRDGVHPTSSGCLIHQGYVHIAMPYLDGRNIRQALAHELMHNCVVHLQLPLWLNEGLAVVFDRTVAQWPQPVLDHELRDRHLAYWNPENIQKFWAGVSFGEPGDSNRLSYSLAEIIVNLLLSQSKNFGAFVKHADWNDAGQMAALNILGSDLGQVAATFLGEGNWRPRRQAMEECWEAAKSEEEGKQ